MDMHAVVRENPVLAIFRNVPSEILLDYAEAVVRGGIRFFEVALNSEDGLEQIRKLRGHFGEWCLIGAGTAITVELAEAALDAGAQFLLTPGTTREVYEFCAKQEAALLPGVCTPGDVAMSLAYGFRTMKLFPAQCAAKGYVKALQGPFDGTEYVAIGGVSPENIQEFFEEGYAGVGLAGGLMPKEIVREEDWDAGAAYVQSYVKKVTEWRRLCGLSD
ncbi:MAG: bifunctional 4-hydroxy-2-oxoglutarate aldolase/2-dehydro-3-deoxy-phosphogluconate aldolase [Eubacteriales bacterium]|nr:bifunctional 4-hydroxy-2-oxoglutarate aldolase/2-dehydro-3-deoxy-phosphogluconate aldolase [Eubacteriales bacterium]